MLAAARSYYSSWQPGQAASGLAAIASPALSVFDPCWAPSGQAQPASREEAAAAMEEAMQKAGGELKFDARSIAHAEGTNMVRPPLQPSITPADARDAACKLCTGEFIASAAVCAVAAHHTTVCP